MKAREGCGGDVIARHAEICRKTSPVVVGPPLVEASVPDREVRIISDVLRLSHVLQVMDDLAQELEGLSESRLTFSFQRLGQGVEQGLARVPVRALLSRRSRNRAGPGKRPIGRRHLRRQRWNIQTFPIDGVVEVPKIAGEAVFEGNAVSE